MQAHSFETALLQGFCTYVLSCYRSSAIHYAILIVHIMLTSTFVVWYSGSYCNVNVLFFSFPDYFQSMLMMGWKEVHCRINVLFYIFYFPFFFVQTSNDDSAIVLSLSFASSSLLKMVMDYLYYDQAAVVSGENAPPLRACPYHICTCTCTVCVKVPWSPFEICMFSHGACANTLAIGMEYATLRAWSFSCNVHCTMYNCTCTCTCMYCMFERYHVYWVTNICDLKQQFNSWNWR